MAKNEVAAKKGTGRATKSHAPELSVLVKTSGDFKSVMSALMKGVLSGEVTPHQANAACNAGGKLLKVVEMEIKYKKTNGLLLSE